MQKAFPYYGSNHSRPSPLTLKSDAVSHFIPLSNGAHPLEGPNRCIFSAPPNTFVYSPDTQEVVKTLISEAKLNFKQRNGFQSILRKGEPLPTRPQDVYRQEMCKHRHAERARALGFPIMPYSNSNLQIGGVGLGFGSVQKKRSLEQIKRTTSLENASIGNRRRSSYVPPIDKEKEKDRLAHKMATGKDPSPMQSVKHVSKQVPKEESIQNRFLELVDEIQDRLEFLLDVDNNPQYHGQISGQIQQLVKEMEGIDRTKAHEVVKGLGLMKLLKMERSKPSQIQDIIFSSGSNDATNYYTTN